MTPYLNCVIETKSDNESGLRTYQRVIWINPPLLALVNIDLRGRETQTPKKKPNRQNTLPFFYKISDLVIDLDSGKSRVIDLVFRHTLISDEELSTPRYKKYKEIMDIAWQIIEPLIKDPNIPDILYPGKRSELISARLSVVNQGRKKKITKASMYKWLSYYWQYGMIPKALLPRWDLCAGPEVVEGQHRRGKKSPCEKNIIITEDIKIKFDIGIKIYLNGKDQKITLHDAYEEMLRQEFNSGFETKKGYKTSIVLPDVNLPSFDQFRNYYYNQRKERIEEFIRRRYGEREFNQKHRALGGDSSQDSFGPGSCGQMDSTSLKIYTVASHDRSVGIQILTLHLIIDVATRLFSGFSLEDGGPTWDFGAALAIYNVAEDKSKVCNAYDIQDFQPWQWPSNHVFSNILTDLGETSGRGPDSAIHHLRIAVHHTPPYRPELKPYIERAFKELFDELVQEIPGAVLKDKFRGRDPKFDACLTRHEITQILIRCIIAHNTRRLKSFIEDEPFIEAGIEPRPCKIWEWHVDNGTHALRIAQEDYVRLHLLRTDTGSISPEGIKFKKKLYTCDRFTQAGWGVLARFPNRKKSLEVKVHYHPGMADAIWLFLPDRSFLPCEIHPKFSRYRGKSFLECEQLDNELKKRSFASVDSDRARESELKASNRATVSRAKASKILQTKGLYLSRITLKKISIINRLVEKKLMQKEVVDLLKRQGGLQPEHSVCMPVHTIVTDFDLDTINQCITATEKKGGINLGIRT